MTNRTRRFLTFNIHWGVGGDNVYNLERIAKVIREQTPDYVALQEVHFYTSEFGENQAAALAQRTSMHYFFHPVIQGTPRDQGGTGSYGNAILTRQPIAQTKAVSFPASTGYSLSQEPRGVCAVRTADDPFWFATFYPSGVRCDGLRAMCVHATSRRLPFVLADFHGRHRRRFQQSECSDYTEENGPHSWMAGRTCGTNGAFKMDADILKDAPCQHGSPINALITCT